MSNFACRASDGRTLQVLSEVCRCNRLKKALISFCPRWALITKLAVRLTGAMSIEDLKRLFSNAPEPVQLSYLACLQSGTRPEIGAPAEQRIHPPSSSSLLSFGPSQPQRKFYAFVRWLWLVISDTSVSPRDEPARAFLAKRKMSYIKKYVSCC